MRARGESEREEQIGVKEGEVEKDREKRKYEREPKIYEGREMRERKESM